MDLNDLKRLQVFVVELEGIWVGVTEDRLVNNFLYLVQATIIKEFWDVSAKLSKSLGLILIDLILQLIDLVALSIHLLLVIVS